MATSKYLSPDKGNQTGSKKTGSKKVYEYGIDVNPKPKKFGPPQGKRSSGSKGGR